MILKRVQKCHELLKTDLEEKEIGRLLGFKHHSHFSLWKRKMGIRTSGRLRRWHKNTFVNFKPITYESLIKLYVEEEKTMADISRLTGYSSTTVSKRLKQFGIEKRSRFLVDNLHIEKSELANLYLEKNMRRKQIAKQLDLSINQVGLLLKKHKIFKNKKSFP